MEFVCLWNYVRWETGLVPQCPTQEILGLVLRCFVMRTLNCPRTASLLFVQKGGGGPFCSNKLSDVIERFHVLTAYLVLQTKDNTYMSLLMSRVMSVDKWLELCTLLRSSKCLWWSCLTRMTNMLDVLNHFRLWKENTMFRNLVLLPLARNVLQLNFWVNYIKLRVNAICV
jgi:hypothetical protein